MENSPTPAQRPCGDARSTEDNGQRDYTTLGSMVCGRFQFTADTYLPGVRLGFSSSRERFGREVIDHVTCRHALLIPGFESAEGFAGVV